MILKKHDEYPTMGGAAIYRIRVRGRLDPKLSDRVAGMHIDTLTRDDGSAESVLEGRLADQAAFGLSSDEQEELSALLEITPNFDQDCMQRMAATVHLANVGKYLEPLPTSLQRRIRASAYLSQRPSTELGRDCRHSDE